MIAGNIISYGTYRSPRPRGCPVIMLAAVMSRASFMANGPKSFYLLMEEGFWIRSPATVVRPGTWGRGMIRDQSGIGLFQAWDNKVGWMAYPARGPAVAKTGCWFSLIPGEVAKWASPRQHGTVARFTGGNADRKGV